MKEVIFFIGTLANGGAERAVSNLSLKISNEYNSKIILYGSKSKIDYEYNGELVYLDKLNEKNIFYKFYAAIRRLLEIRNIKISNPDVAVISFLEYPNLINALSYKKGRTIVSVRNHMSTKHNKGIKSYFWNSTIRYLYGKTDKIIAVSEEIKRDLVTNYGINESKIEVIYNSYHINDIKKLAQESIENEYIDIFKNPVIITVGRFNKQKGHDHLIRAFSKVKSKVPNAQLVILGQGRLENKLKDLSEELGLNGSIHFLGFKENPFKYISKSKLFILSSLHEGFPNALAEAMVCEIPIISTDCLSGPREILAPKEFIVDNIKYDFNKDRYGVLIPVCNGEIYNSIEKLTEDEKLMAKAIIKLLNDEELWNHFSEKSGRRAKDFDIENIIEEWKNVIQN